jgi:protein-S-isoprenylcysteine O-methyltransferase Ste14
MRVGALTSRTPAHRTVSVHAAHDATPAATAGVIAPPPLIYLIPLGGALLLHRINPVPLIPWQLRHFTPIIAAAFAIPASILVVAVVALRRAGTRPEPWKPTTALVTTGPFRVSRNPMYLGLTLMYVAITVWRNSLWPMLLLPGVMALMHYGVIRREEEYLTRLFGGRYKDYRRRVRRWL